LLAARVVLDLFACLNALAFGAEARVAAGRCTWGLEAVLAGRFT
jgi:hypothetical protein